MNDFKKRIQNAIEKHATNQLPKRPTGRKNNKPERQLQKQMIEALKQIGVFAFHVESKAVYSASAGAYLNSQTVVGCADILGVTPQGQFLAVEVKSPGRRSTLREAQCDFLTNVIERGGFAVCSDSLEHLLALYSEWLTTDLCSRAPLLRRDLPTARKKHNKSGDDAFDNW
jgi:hypothetical protein